MNKKSKIKQAALKLLVERGEQATSMKCIANEAKCGIGTMYNYFPSKDELINELYIELKIKLFSFILEILDANVPVKKQFFAMWMKAIEFTTSHTMECKFLNTYAHSPKISKESVQEINKLLFPIINIFERGKKEEIIKDIETVQLITFINGAIRASTLGYPNISEKEKNQIILMAWDAIKK